MLTFPDIVNTYFQVYIHFQLFHWQTNQYASHMASDMALRDLSKKMDQMVEVWSQGVRVLQRQQVSPPSLSSSSSLWSINAPSKITKQRLLQKCRAWKSQLRRLDQVRLPPDSQTELLNLRDELLEILDRTSYLLSLH